MDPIMTVVAGTWRKYPPDGAEGHTVVGDLRVLEQLESPELKNRRDIYVHLPSSYEAEAGRRYPVIYMHDGQNLFDQAIAFGEEWRIDETMAALERPELEAIIVGVPNMGEERLGEYSPFEDPRHGGGHGATYLRFLTGTLKPLIDECFRTRPERESTGIAGSSMGGLISLYAYFQAREVFGFVGAMSPALWFAERAIFDFLKRSPVVPGRIYLDVGTAEGRYVVQDVRRARTLLYRKGYDAERELRYVEERGAGHTEGAWANRFRQALPFLLGVEAERPHPARS
jgi:predicted alpha/beta superfamily hydrolase